MTENILIGPYFLIAHKQLAMTVGASVISQTTKSDHSDAGPVNCQLFFSSRRWLQCIYSVTLLEHRTTHLPSEQPSTICHWTGNVCKVDEDEPGFE